MTTRRILDLIEVVDKLHPEGEPVTISDLDLETSDVPDAVELHRTALIHGNKSGLCHALSL